MMGFSAFCTLQIVIENNTVQRTNRCPQRRRSTAYIHDGLVSVPGFGFGCRGAPPSASGHGSKITTTVEGVDASVYP